ncbi:MAG: hypothetical protein LBB24_00040, partial [Rickettsiales bacterium]|nr:hypothetical protein [Rickettsiales bacterium]
MDERIRLIDSHFRTLNYVSASLLFLKNNVFLRRKLESDDVKDLVVGHWGCCPGINYILAHIFDFVSNNLIKFQIVFGTGHCSPSVISNLFVNRILDPGGKKYPTTEEGLKNLCCDFYRDTTIRSELNGNLPKIVISGGELGISIATAFGYCLSNRGRIVFCILGDGEFEAGCNEQALFCNNFLNPSEDAMPVLIVNLNNFKMCSSSLLSTMKGNLRDFFESLGYQYFYCGTDSRDFLDVFREIKSIHEEWTHGKVARIPLVIVDSPKGWTAPDKICGIQFTNSHNSHKVSVLSTPKKVEGYVDIIEKWLKSYNFSPDSLELAGTNANIIGKLYGDVGHRSDSIDDMAALEHFEVPRVERYSPMEAVSDYLLRYIGTVDSNYLIFSPDEIVSNKLRSCVNNLNYRGRNRNGNIIEILNENVCLNMLNGYVSSGGNGIFVTYEAFAPLISSSVSQIYKFYRETRKSRKIGSLNIIITSLGWRNVYTHQNPDIINTFLSKTDNSTAKVYFPVDADQAVSVLQRVIASYGRLNLICLSKCDLGLRNSATSGNPLEPDEDFFYIDMGKSSSVGKDTARKIVTIIVIGDIIYDR